MKTAFLPPAQYLAMRIAQPKQRGLRGERGDIAANEAFSRVEIIRIQIKDKDLDVPVTNFVPFQYVPPEKTEASYVRCGRDGRVFAVIEGRSQSSLCVVGQRAEAINRAEAAFQALLAGAFSGDLTSVATAREAVGA